ncbi:hypothetical protein SLE2022_158960 [Rubroshorea leprosula]
MDDRSWIDRRVDNSGFVTDEFKEGVQFFVRFAFSRPNAKSEIKCPCSKCKCRKWGNPEVVSVHLCKHGFMNNYYTWYVHGETSSNTVRNFEGESSNMEFVRNEVNTLYREMVVDAMGAQPEYNDGPMAEEPNSKAREFYDLLHAAEVHIGAGGQDVTVLSWMAEMLNMKTLYNMSAANWQMALSLSRKLLSPEDQEKVPKDFYSAKKMINVLGLGYKKIDICVNDCFLYYDEQSKNLTACPVCGESRYEARNMSAIRQKDVPRKSLWYLPITPRLQRLYMSRKTAEHMTWHLKCRDDADEVIHPAGSEAWKHFDETHPTFADEPRNVRLGLCTDGFNPFGCSATPYSCWPVFLTVYNLPPELCMKSEHIFLAMIIAGPKSPGKNIDVMLRPLIDELKELWANGVETYDSFRQQNFIMKAALLWTISDFPGYAMLSGWSTHGKLSCPYCMENTKAFQLQYGRKTSFFDCHRQFLPPKHPFRRDKKNFYLNRVEKSRPPPRLDGTLMEERVNQLPDIVFGQPLRQKHSIAGFGVFHNWVKRSIFWELPYWKDLLIRHNLDVMHCEKNFLDNIKNTVMDDKGCMKDNTNARLDLQLYCNRSELELIPQDDGTAIKPNASYVLSRQQRALICQWLKELRFPDGYASNIARCVNMQELRLFGMKSHDCHVFMQRLLPIAFRDFLIDQVWGPLTEISNFFRALTAPIIQVSNMEMWEEKIVETICKLEKVFPPAFFDSMEHLAIHLPYEAKVGGPVQFRWMYPFERKMHDLKKTVLNKNRVEASICESNILSEISFFCSHYFGSNIETRLNRQPRNIVGMSDDMDNCLSVFKHRGQALGGEMRMRALSPKELKAAELYVLLNCEEVNPWIALFDYQVCSGLSEDQIQIKRQLEFIPWFKTTVRSGRYEVDSRLLPLVTGPVNNVRVYNGYWVNGFRFHTIAYGQNKKTMNSGVCVKGATFNDESDYYGSLKEIIELQYFDSYVHQSVILFKCEWYDISKGIVVHPTSGIVDINPRFKLQTDEPFILSSQAQQVFYARYPSQNPCRKGWFAACKIRARAIIDTSSLTYGGNVYYQDDDPPMPQLVQPSTVLNDHVSLASQRGEEVVISEVMQLPYVTEEECVGEDDDEEEEFDGTETSEEEVPNYLTESDSD